MEKYNLSPVEKSFFRQSRNKSVTTQIPYISVDNFPKLGLFTALRFLEWVSENPNGVVSLPTGKTPEFFIKWTNRIVNNWDDSQIKELRKNYGLNKKRKPDLKNLQFVQIDEFYPISSSQHNSFYHYVNEYYIKGFGLNPEKALVINSDAIPLPEGKHYSEIFPDNHVDLSLRYREAKTSFELLQQKAVFAIDDWCTSYENAIQDKGGIGFFLGGIGPDGHIAFNTRGSDHHSTTRLTATNFETQAVAASDLGGIEISRNRLVITIGLQSITRNPDTVAIIFAAGEAKAHVVKDALEKEKSNIYPASALHTLKNARFYLTAGAASALEDSVELCYKSGEWTHDKTERAVIDLCRKLGKYGHHLTIEDLKKDKYCNMIPNVGEDTVQTVIDSIIGKMQKGMEDEYEQTYYHTGPHHDDIMLGILPHIHRLLRNESNMAYFSVLTSGFTAVTNQFLRDALEDTKRFLNQGFIQMVNYPDFFDIGYSLKWDKDVYHYLNKVASGEPFERRRGLAHRIIRAIVIIHKVRDREQLLNRIDDILAVLRRSYDGEKNPPAIQTLKGMIREFEEELVWAHFGVQVKNVHHLRLGFYTGDVFTQQPERDRDVKPILKKLKDLNPTVISLAFDPEGSGPDTHYKVLQAIADAVRLWQKEADLSHLRIWGYRNVWYRFHPAEATVIVPVSLNALAVLEDSFTNCYLSQVDASFPSYQHDGKFSELTKNTWVDQLKTIQLLLGKNYFYQSPSPRIRSTHGMLYFREMNVAEFLASARELEKSMEGVDL
jgi:glucosamine-6-phosphate deaminase